LGSRIAALEDCFDAADAVEGDHHSIDAYFVRSLWSSRDDLCAGLIRLHSYAVESSSSIDDQLELLKKLLMLQTSKTSLVPSDGDAISLQAAHTVLLLDDAYEAQSQGQLSPQDASELIGMLSQALRAFEHHSGRNESLIFSTLVRLHTRHSAAGSFRESLSYIEKAIAAYPLLRKDGEEEGGQKGGEGLAGTRQYNRVALAMMLFNSHLKLGQSEQVFDDVALSFECLLLSRTAG
jgi:hypothetical protein